MAKRNEQIEIVRSQNILLEEQRKCIKILIIIFLIE